MADDKSKVGKADRDRIAEDEPYEVEALAKKYGMTTDQARTAIRAYGPMRKDIEAHLTSGLPS